MQSAKTCRAVELRALRELGKGALSILVPFLFTKAGINERLGEEKMGFSQLHCLFCGAKVLRGYF